MTKREGREWVGPQNECKASTRAKSEDWGVEGPEALRGGSESRKHFTEGQKHFTKGWKHFARSLSKYFNEGGREIKIFWSLVDLMQNILISRPSYANYLRFWPDLAVAAAPYRLPSKGSSQSLPHPQR
jgi:hypothetical protein